MGNIGTGPPALASLSLFAWQKTVCATSRSCDQCLVPGTSTDRSDTSQLLGCSSQIACSLSTCAESV